MGSQTWKQQPHEASLTTRALKGPDTNSLSSSFQPSPRIYPSDGDSSRQNHIPTSTTNYWPLIHAETSSLICISFVKML